jgi:hypothetical protein
VLLIYDSLLPLLLSIFPSFIMSTNPWFIQYSVNFQEMHFLIVGRLYHVIKKLQSIVEGDCLGEVFF